MVATNRRAFNTSSRRCDEYTVEEGQVIGVFMPLAKLQALAWGPIRSAPPSRYSCRALGNEESAENRERLLSARLEDLRPSDLNLVHKAGDPTLLPLLEHRLAEILERSSQDDQHRA